MKREIPLHGLEGKIFCVEDEQNIAISVMCSDQGEGIYKLILHGENGCCALGTLLPKNGQLQLEKCMASERLRQCRCWPVTFGEAVLAFPFREAGQKGEHSQWQRIAWPGKLLCDTVLKNSAGKCGSWKIKRDADGFFLAARWSMGNPIPLTPLFCLGKMVTLCGETYIQFRFDRNGVPQKPQRDAP